MDDDHLPEKERSRCYVVTQEPMTRAELHARAGMKPPPHGANDIIDFGDRMILCGNLGPKCIMCGDVADVLCDFPIGELGRTCDRELCSRCAPAVPGRDLNYCIPHREDGPGMLLFCAPTSPTEPETKIYKPRLPSPPDARARWRVVEVEGFVNGTRVFFRVVTAWTDEITARRFANAKIGRIVQHWEDFVAWHRMMWPLKRPKKEE